MAARRARKPIKAPVAAPPPPEPEDKGPKTFHPMPPAERRWRRWAEVHKKTTRQMAEMVEKGLIRIPPFQREYVWDDEHIIYLLDSILRGYYVGNVTLWEQYKLPATRVNVGGIEADGAEHGYLVVDGQQRIGAIARALLTPRYSFDFNAMKFVVESEPAKDRIPLHLVNHRDVDDTMQILRGIKSDLWSAEQAGYLSDSLLYRDVCATVLPYEWEIDQVMEMFRRMNTAGIRMDPADVEAALLRARAA